VAIARTGYSGGLYGHFVWIDCPCGPCLQGGPGPSKLVAQKATVAKCHNSESIDQQVVCARRAKMKTSFCFLILGAFVGFLVMSVEKTMFCSARNELFWDAERASQEEGQKVAKEILLLGQPAMTFAPWTKVGYATQQFVDLSVRAENICAGSGKNEPARCVIHDVLATYAFGVARLRAENIVDNVKALQIAGQDSGFRYAQKLASRHYDLANFSSIVLRAKTWDELSALRQALGRRRSELDWLRATKSFELGRPKKTNAQVLDMVV